MRDISRIDPFIKEFEALWKANPDMRFGQMITWVSHFLPTCDMFYCEEKDWLKAIQECKK